MKKNAMLRKKVTPTEAIAIQHEIQKACVQKGLWVKVEHDNRPDLRMIRMEISIKVEDELRPTR